MQYFLQKQELPPSQKEDGEGHVPQISYKRSDLPKGRTVAVLLQRGFCVIPLYLLELWRFSPWKQIARQCGGGIMHVCLPACRYYKRKILISRSHEFLKVNLLARAWRGSSANYRLFGFTSPSLRSHQSCLPGGAAWGQVGAGNFLSAHPSPSPAARRGAAHPSPPAAFHRGTQPGCGQPWRGAGAPRGKPRASLLIPCGKEVLSEHVRAFNFRNAEQKDGRPKASVQQGRAVGAGWGGDAAGPGSWACWRTCTAPMRTKPVACKSELHPRAVMDVKRLSQNTAAAE